MTRTSIDLDLQSDLPLSEANLKRLADESQVDDLHKHSRLCAQDGSPDPALYIDNDGKTRGLKLPLETTLACNSNYEVGEMFIYYASGQGKYYLAYKDAEGSAKAVNLGTNVTLT